MNKNICLILNFGSSIKDENLKPLKDEIVIALNNFYAHDDFAEIMSGDTAKYYMTASNHPPQTETEWMKWLKEMEKSTSHNVNMLFGINSYKGNIKFILDEYKMFQQHKVNWYYAGVSTNSKFYSFNKKNIDITNPILDAGASSIYALIIAIYMGFEEIYLIGMDHNHICVDESQWRFYKDALHQKDEMSRSIGDKSYNLHNFTATASIFKRYQLLKNNTESKIYNTSNISLLDIFKYKELANSTHKCNTFI